MSTYNDLLLIIFVVVTIPAIAYWMGYRSGEKSGELRVYKGLQEKNDPEIDATPSLADSTA
jgi:hypothetical protein